MKTLLILDTHALLHRAYHALPDFRSPSGEPTGALYGFSTMLMRALKEMKPDYVVAAFDLPGKTFRHEAYEHYKAKRPETESDLISQLKRAHELVNAFEIPAVSKEGYEADDMIGTIVKKLKNKKDLKIIIVSGDVDMLQLVLGDRVSAYSMRKGIADTVLYNEKKVVERFGFAPKLIPDFKGLKGDPSDNIVGVPGVGEKTATELIKRFGSLENMYKNVPPLPTKERGRGGEVKERIAKLLLDHKEDAFFSRQLATIHSDVKISFSLPSKKYTLPVARVAKIFSELGFVSLAKRIEGLTSPPQPPSSYDKRRGEEREGILSEGGGVTAREVRIMQWVLRSDNKNPDPALNLDALKQELKEKGLEKVYYEIELPLMPILAAMKSRGIGVDQKFLKSFEKEIAQKIDSLEKQIYKVAGTTFNIASPIQVGEVLQSLGIAGRKRTKTGRISTQESELIKLKDKHSIIALLLEHRELSKLLGTYIKPFQELSEGDGRIHTTFNQTGTVTGRLSSDSPNLQNIPIRRELGARIRDAFVASPGFTFVAFDYSQIELKILAALSDDKKMIVAFKSGADIHRSVAAEINNVPPDAVTPQMRSRAKAINFGIVFGMGVRRLAASTGMSQEEAQKFYAEYFHDFPDVKKYTEHIKHEVRRVGYAETLMGRKRFFDVSRISGDRFLEAEMERMAVNAVIQGTDADIVKSAMIAVNKKFDNDDVRLLLQIHDELLYEIRDDIVKKVALDMRETMERVVDLSVPLSVDIKIGKRWGSLSVFI